MTYTLFNIVLLLMVAPACIYFLEDRKEILIAARTTTFIVLIAVPWDAWAIRASVWAYKDPGLWFAGIPLNDIVFIALCTLLTSSFLIYLRKRASGNETQTKHGSSESS